MVCTAVSAAVLPWGSPSFIALIGHALDDNTQAVLEIAYEWPISWLRTAAAMSQEELEWFHVQRFRSDHVLGTGSHPFVNVRKGSDPPNVFVATTEGDVGLECTRFTVGARQEAHGLFRAVRRRVASVAPEHFAALAGHVVYMWFNGDGSVLARPFRRGDEEAALELVRALAEYRPDTSELWMPSGEGPPDPAPDLRIQPTDAGAAFYCVPLVNSVPDSVLFNFAGFELGLAFTTTHEARREAELLVDRIRAKDRQGSEWSLISAGAPDRLGVLYPAEEALADFILQNVELALELEHLSRVTIHFWSTGKAVDIWPNRRVLFGPMYLGNLPAQKQIVPSS